MEKYTLKERVQIIQAYYKKSRSLTLTIRELRNHFPRNHVPAKSTVQSLVARFVETGSLGDLKKSPRPRTARSSENVAAVAENVRETPGTSIRHRSQELNISRTSLQRILTKDLHLHAYKIQLCQELKPLDHFQRRTFVDWALQKKEDDDDFFDKIILSDEAHFHLGGYVNKQNCRIWGSENPRAVEQLPMHPKRVTVWCGFWLKGVIGPFFFENDDGKAVTVNGKRYRDMLTGYFWHQLEGLDLADIWFQQDDAPCHTASETMALLQTKFPQHVISQRGDVIWPPRSCDLTPLDFFLWGHVKGKVYADNPQTIPQLKDNIERVIGEIDPSLCENVMKNFGKRLMVCKKSRGGYLEDILFHY